MAGNSFLHKVRITHYTRFAGVTFFAAVVLLVEILLFHVFNYIHDYFVALLAISYAILGIGFGAFLAKRMRMSEKALFVVCCLGTTLLLYGAIFVIVLYPAVWLLSFVTPLCFIFPALYITRIFADHRSEHVYLYDMVGAGFGVVLTVALFAYFISEEIFLIAVSALPLVGLLGTILWKGRWWKCTAVIFLLLTAFASLCLCVQLGSDAFNLFRIINREAPFSDSSKALIRFNPDNLVQSYDSLTGRIDVIKSKSHIVLYDGHANDHFTPSVYKDYQYYKRKGITEPTVDVRVFYGVVRDPRVFVFGSSAQGIVKPLKQITPADHIVPVEINPGILRIMQHDFYMESGGAYKDLEPRLGNALSVLKSIPDLFDIITLINTHTSRSISHRGAPEYLHTFESYNMYFDHLSDDGYLLFEERLMNRGGEMGFYRMINTLWHVLQERGTKDPSRHFVVWEWMNRGSMKFSRNNSRYYISMIVTKEPIGPDRREVIIAGLDRILEGRKSATRIAYLKEHESTQEYERLFSMIEEEDYSPLAAENFDASLITNNRPFAAFSTTHTPRLNKLLLHSGIASIFLWALFTLGMVRGKKKLKAVYLNAFNLLTGAGYFLIEIILMLTYQNIFIAPSSSFILVLGVLLISSGIGGLFANRARLGMITMLIIPVSLVAIGAPSFLMTVSIPFFLVRALSVLFIALTGFFMGMYFPKGLILAKKEGFQDRVPYFFAISSIAGSFAVVLAFFLGVVVGYRIAILLAFACYAGATMIIRRFEQQT